MVTMEIDDGTFRDMLWERINNFYPAQNCYPDWVWEGIFDDLESMGWLKPEYNYPSYIIDNLAINGEIKPYEDVEAEYDLGGMSVEEYVENNGGYILTNPDDENEKYVVLSYGL